MRQAAEEQVIVFCLPPSTTHLTQHLDKGAFGPLKVYWNEECQNYMSKNPGKVITQYTFMPVFSKSWYRAMTIPNIMSAFHTTGVHPFNHYKVEVSDSMLHKFDPKALAEKNGLAFLPSYTPVCSKSTSAPKSTLTFYTEKQAMPVTQTDCAQLRIKEGYHRVR